MRKMMRTVKQHLIIQGLEFLHKTFLANFLESLGKINQRDECCEIHHGFMLKVKSDII